MVGFFIIIILLARYDIACERIYLLLVSVDFTFMGIDVLGRVELFLANVTLEFTLVGVRIHVILDKVTHTVSLIHLLRSTGVITRVTREDRLHLMHFKVMFGHLASSTLDSFLTNLAFP
jgi:hypothetical protein